MCHTLCKLYGRRTIWYDNIFSRYIQRHLPPDVGIIIYFLKRRPSKAKAIQHALMLWTILHHIFGEFVVHVGFYTLGGFKFLFCFFAKNFYFDRTCSRKRLRHSFGLESNSRFSKHCRIYSTSSFPRCCALFIFKS